MDNLSDPWLFSNIIAGALSMKAVRNVINEYDAELPIALNIMARQVANADAEALQGDDEGAAPYSYSVDGVSCTVGDYVLKFFPSYGCYEGTVVGINLEAFEGKVIRIRYLDGDVEDITNNDLIDLKTKAYIPIGDIGFQLIKKFNGQYFSGIVVRISEGNQKCLCEFNNGKKHSYTLSPKRSIQSPRMAMSYMMTIIVMNMYSPMMKKKLMIATRSQWWKCKRLLKSIMPM